MKITDPAKERLQAVLGENPGKALRVVFEGFGWGGPRLGLALDEPKETDTSLTVAGIPVVLDPQVRPLVAGQVLDYVRAFGSQGFLLKPEFGGGAC